MSRYRLDCGNFLSAIWSAFFFKLFKKSNLNIDIRFESHSKFLNFILHVSWSLSTRFHVCGRVTVICRSDVSVQVRSFKFFIHVVSNGVPTCPSYETSRNPLSVVLLHRRLLYRQNHTPLFGPEIYNRPSLRTLYLTSASCLG